MDGPVNGRLLELRLRLTEAAGSYLEGQQAYLDATSRGLPTPAAALAATGPYRGALRELPDYLRTLPPGLDNDAQIARAEYLLAALERMKAAFAEAVEG